MKSKSIIYHLLTESEVITGKSQTAGLIIIIIIIIIIGDLYSAHVLCSRRFTIIDLSI